MNNSSFLFIFAGEPSGDMHGAQIIKELKKSHDSLAIIGVGGPELTKQGLNSLVPMSDFCVMGYSDVLKSLPTLLKHYNTIKKEILSKSPEMVVFIDSPGFSLRMAKTLRKKGYKGKLIQYICPTVWAWGEKRIDEMSKTLDLLLTIYPFEKNFFSHTDLQVTYVGNPVKEAIDHYPTNKEWKALYNIPEDKKILSLFPGSRKGEISRHLNLMLETAILAQKTEPNVILALSSVNDSYDDQIKKSIGKAKLTLGQDIFIIKKEHSYDLMRSSYAAIAKSGTVTLELALNKCPTIVIYALTRLNRFIATYLMKLNLPFYCIVNILKDKEIFPELIKKEPSPSDIASAMLPFLTNQKKKEECQNDCSSLNEILGNNSPSKLAAKAINDLKTKP